MQHYVVKMFKNYDFIRIQYAIKNVLIKIRKNQVSEKKSIILGKQAHEH